MQGNKDLETLGLDIKKLYDAADEEFWGYEQFDAVVATFNQEDSTRRVLGIEGVSSKKMLEDKIQNKEKLKIGNLTLTAMNEKLGRVTVRVGGLSTTSCQIIPM